jgi:streptogramin lyase
MGIPDFLNTRLPLFSIRVRGKWKNSKIFQVIKGKQFLRAYTEYDGSAKGHLIKFQSKFAAAVWSWQQMAYNDRRFYISRASKLGLRISGYNYFISLYMRDKLEGDMGYPDPHHLSHEKGGADEISVKDLSGLLADEQNAGKIKGVIIDDTEKADEKVLGYKQSTDRIVYLTSAGGGVSEAQVAAMIASHAGKPWSHPWQRSPLLRYQLRKTETFDLTSGENHAKSICFDGTHIWIGLFTSPAKIIKMDPADGTYTVYTLSSGENNAESICFDGTHIWIGLTTSPAKIIKMDPADGTYTVYTLLSGENNAQAICFDGTHIWIGLWTSPAKIIKMDPADGTYTAYTLASGEDIATGICFDGTHIWIGLYTSEAIIIKMDPADGTYTAYELSKSNDFAYSICFDGAHIWIGLNTVPARIIKMDPADGTFSADVLSSGEDSARSICFDGTHIWIGLNISPAKVIKMNPADGSYTTYTLSSGENIARAICFDGAHVWVGLSTSPAKIQRITKV